MANSLHFLHHSRPPVLTPVNPPRVLTAPALPRSLFMPPIARGSPIEELTADIQRMSFTSSAHAPKTPPLSSSNTFTWRLLGFAALVGAAAGVYLYKKDDEDLIFSPSRSLENYDDRLALLKFLKKNISILEPQILGDILQRLSHCTYWLDDEKEFEIIQLILQELFANGDKKLLELQKMESDSPWLLFELSISLTKFTKSRFTVLHETIKNKIFQPAIERACSLVKQSIRQCKANERSYDEWKKWDLDAKLIMYRIATFMSDGSKHNPQLTTDALFQLFPQIIECYQTEPLKLEMRETGLLANAMCNIYYYHLFDKQKSQELSLYATSLFSLSGSYEPLTFDDKCFQYRFCSNSEFAGASAIREAVSLFNIPPTRAQSYAEYICKNWVKYKLIEKRNLAGYAHLLKKMDKISKNSGRKPDSTFTVESTIKTDQGGMVMNVTIHWPKKR